MESPFYEKEWVDEQVKLGRHRELIGGLWEEIGQLQLEFMRGIGLQPENLLIDVGCGSLRGGVKFVEFLEPGNYYGIDLNQSLLDAGYQLEIRTNSALANKLPVSNLRCVDNFDATDFGRSFDYAIAQSLLTHLTLNNIRRCLENIHKSIRCGGKFCATYFQLPDDRPYGVPYQQPRGGIITNDTSDPYHYRVDDFHHAMKGLPWVLVGEQDWNHPRAQRMLIFART